MGSYLSAPMLVFRLGVLARACEAPRGADPLATGPDTPTTARVSLVLAPSLPFSAAPYRHASHHFSRSICARRSVAGQPRSARDQSARLDAKWALIGEPPLLLGRIYGTRKDTDGFRI